MNDINQQDIGHNNASRNGNKTDLSYTDLAGDSEGEIRHSSRTKNNTLNKSDNNIKEGFKYNHSKVDYDRQRF